jgi:hypothetical protein
MTLTYTRPDGSIIRWVVPDDTPIESIEVPEDAELVEIKSV